MHANSAPSESFKIDIGRLASKLQVSEQALTSKIRSGATESSCSPQAASALGGGASVAVPIAGGVGAPASPFASTGALSASAPRGGAGGVRFCEERADRKGSTLTFGVPRRHSGLDPDSVGNLSGSPKAAAGGRSRSPDERDALLTSQSPSRSKFSLLSTVDAQAASPQRLRGGPSFDASSAAAFDMPGVDRQDSAVVTVHRGVDGAILLSVQEPWSPGSLARFDEDDEGDGGFVDEAQQFQQQSDTEDALDELPEGSDDDNAASVQQPRPATPPMHRGSRSTTPQTRAQSALREAEGETNVTASRNSATFRVEDGRSSSSKRRASGLDPSGSQVPDTSVVNTAVARPLKSALRRSAKTPDATTATTAVAAAPAAASSSSAPSSSRRVHFGEECIKSVVLVQRDEQLLLQVEYNRPVWTWLCAIAVSTCFAGAWTALCTAAYPSDRAGESVARSIALLAAVMHGAAAVVALLIFIISWRPQRYEKVLLRSRRALSRLAVCAGAFALGQTALAGALMLGITAASIAAFFVTPSIAIFLWEVFRHRIVAPLDIVGAVVVVGGIATLAVGEARQQQQQPQNPLRWVGLLVAFGGALLHAVFILRQRRLRGQLSFQLVHLLSQGTAAIACALLAACAEAYHTPLGDDSTVGVFALRGTALGSAVLMAGAMAAATTVHHYVAAYFDTLTIAAWFATGAPLTVLFFHTTALPHMDRVEEIVGGGLVIAGCVALFVAGYRHRRNVEVAINVESVADASTDAAGAE